MKKQEMSITEKVQLFLMAMMFLGFMFSRALLSISMIISFVVAIYIFYQKKHLWKKVAKTKEYFMVVLFFIIHLISGFWANNLAVWSLDIQLKLPLLVLPIILFSYPFYKKNFFQLAIYTLQAVLLLGIAYTIFNLLNDIPRFLEGRRIVGPVGNGDYLRFGMALILGINLSVYSLIKYRKEHNAKIKNFQIAFIILSVVYLHIQSSKLGLISLYVLGAFLTVILLKAKWGWKKLSLVFAFGIMGIYFAGRTIPVFKYQIELAQLELEAWKKADIDAYNESGVSSFVPRVISYDVAWSTIKESPLIGYGAGNVLPTMENVYEEDYPGYNAIITVHNQVLNSMVAFGIPVGIGVLLLLLWPIIASPSLFEKANALALFTACLVEAMLEIQHGLFVYLFFTFWWIAKREMSLLHDTDSGKTVALDFIDSNLK